MTRDRLVVPFEIKASEESDGRVFEGYGSVFGVLDSYADVVAKGAFKRTLKDAKAKGRMPAMLWQHNPDDVVGVWTEMREDDHGLFVKGEIFESGKGPLAYEALKKGGVSGLSIGFRTLKSKLDDENGIRTLTELELWEVSLVTFPANDAARVSSVKASGEIPNEREFEEWLRRDAGLSRAEAKRVIATCYRRLLCDAADLTNPEHIAGRHVDGHQSELIEGLKSLRSVLAGAASHGSRSQDAA